MRHLLLFTALVVLLAGCVSSQTQRAGMVEDPNSPYMYGARSDSAFIADPELFRNKRLKLRIRNTSGDQAFDLHGFKGQLLEAYRSTGYEPAESDYGILMDVNVVYSGQISENMSSQFTFLGTTVGAGAGLAGAGTETGGGAAARNFAIGTAAGATIGHILGTYMTVDTYIIVTKVTMMTMKYEREDDGTTLIFVSTRKKRESRDNIKGYRSRETVTFATYAGGRMTSQDEIAGEVRRRMVRILKDVI